MVSPSVVIGSPICNKMVLQTPGISERVSPIGTTDSDWKNGNLRLNGDDYSSFLNGRKSSLRTRSFGENQNILPALDSLSHRIEYRIVIFRLSTIHGHATNGLHGPRRLECASSRFTMNPKRSADQQRRIHMERWFETTTKGPFIPSLAYLHSSFENRRSQDATGPPSCHPGLDRRFDRRPNNIDNCSLPRP